MGFEKFIATKKIISRKNPILKFIQWKRRRRKKRKAFSGRDIYNRDPRYSRVKFDDEVVNQARKSVR